MNAITINNRKNTIEITKTFEKEARIFGSEAYKALREARNDNPSFRVVIRKSSSSKGKEHYKGLSYKFMEKYIKGHDDENKTIMKEYIHYRGLDDESIELGIPSLGKSEMIEWFFEKFPNVREYHDQRNEYAEELADKRRSRKETAELEKFEARRNALLAA